MFYFIFLLFIFLGSNSSLEALTPMTHQTGIQIYSETFGDKSNTAILLNAGAGCQSVSWPKEFCEALAKLGYFVIRYDYRDTGLSTPVDYSKNPYTVLDLAKDALFVLDQHDIQKATFVGLSMGGQLSQIAAGFLPERVSKIILIGTSSDFEPGFKAFEGIYSDKGLSPPSKDYVDQVLFLGKEKDPTLEVKINNYVKVWRLIDGNPQNFDEEFFKKQAEETFARTTLHNAYVNHAHAMKASYTYHKQAPTMIKLPTLIIQGGRDPIFPLDHAQDLHKKIQGSQLIYLQDFGHAISPQHFDKLVTLISNFISKK